MPLRRSLSTGTPSSRYVHCDTWLIGPSGMSLNQTARETFDATNSPW